MSLHVFAGPGRGRDTIVVVDADGLHGAELPEGGSARASVELVSGMPTRQALGAEAWSIPFDRLRRVEARILDDRFRAWAEGGRPRTIRLVDRKTRDAVLAALESAWDPTRKRRLRRAGPALATFAAGMGVSGLLGSRRDAVDWGLLLCIWGGISMVAWLKEERLSWEKDRK